MAFLSKLMDFLRRKTANCRVMSTPRQAFCQLCPLCSHDTVSLGFVLESAFDQFHVHNI